MSTQDITSLLENDPPRLHDPEYSPDGIVQSAVSQPLPFPSLEDAMKCTFLLGDYSHGLYELASFKFSILTYLQPSRLPRIGEYSPLVYPQIALRKMLFSPLGMRRQTYGSLDVCEEANLLYQMMNVTGERFSIAQISEGKKADDYFNKNGQLLSMPPYVDDNYGAKIKDLVHLSDVDIALTCGLLSRCLRLNPHDRSDATELLSDPFFVGVD
ncbi:hypothetical protein C0989_002850 [Termitomyces sp. Mn162]|nr:hypothetical protein C0989_002850 [Termitomyces sp. Mn162]